MDPMVRTRTRGKYEKLTERYERVRTHIFEDDDDTEDWASVKKKHREKMFGPDLVALVPFSYTITAFEKKFPDTWYELSLSDRGRFIAHAYLEDAQQTIKEHLRIVEENKQKLKDKK